MKRQSNLFKLLLIVVALFSFSALYAQQMTVSGTVTDAADGMPLPGVTVAVKGTTTGTITTPDGNYTLSVENGQTLVFSFIGYKSQEIVATNTTINVALEEDIIGMEEVVVIGYGTTKKKDLTGSIQTVNADDFNQGAIASPQQLINGKVAGVQITDGGGAPGEGATIRIRGGSSLTASNDPLIIIDGVPLDGGDVGGMRNPLNVVNPNDIETFTVLKDASATAIYGSRASNGVILITTKKGSGAGMKIDYAGNVSVATKANELDILSANQYREVLTDKFPDNVGLMGEASTDWQKEVYRTAVSTDHNLAMSGMIADKMPYRASVGYNLSNGILDESSMERTTASINVNPTFFDDHLRVNLSAKGMFVNNNFSNTGAVGAAISMDPTQMITGDMFEPYGGYFTWTRGDGTPNGNAPDNPRALIDQRVDKSKVNRFIGNAQFDYKFHFLPELRANLNIGMDMLESQDDPKEVMAGAAWDTDAYLRGGSYEKYKLKKENKLLDFYLQYTKNLDAIDSRFDVMGGYSWQHFWTENTSGSWFNLPNEDGDFVRDPENLTRNENYLVSFFGRLNYVLSDKYYLTFTLRNDGSSRFSEDNRWGLFPSVALAWNVKEESFLEGSDVLSTLKMKLGYGVTGQQNIGSDYGYFGTYKSGQPTAQYVYYNNVTGSYDRVPLTTIRPNGYDENLKWEETTTYNIGFDYGFLNNRISGTLDVYLRETKDLLNQIPVPAGANLTNELVTNVGSLENKGFELSVNAIALEGSDYSWSIGANVAYNENEITKLTRVEDPNYLGVQTGGISGGTGNMVQIHQVGQPANSFFVYKQIYGTNGMPIEGLYEDVNGDGQFNESDLRVYKQSAPKVMLGLNTNFNYKNWDFSMAGRANLGQYVYNNMASDGGFYNRMQISGEYLNNLNKDVFNTGFNTAQYLSDYYVQNASFFRMDNITLGYDMSDLLNNNMKMRVYTSVNNVFVITDYEGIDPEVSGGIDNNIYPRPRTFLLGVNVTF
ncbi:TonB-dependent receptor [Carboxylicivirga mesophila]|uniref:TonB-dependent receptor n=1 Tax=Carboxylicivirga mesophila TaxID=1166478 RepID=A0ABS5KCY3_9BACT|nr:TonB-dependent receptor [Carboxylicivirga mesophila]MBS2212863.1 TonB-dependent receptor [Carboxylicivirga mesophila]